MLIGVIIVSVFAIAWVMAGTNTFPRKYFLALCLTAFVISAAIVYAATHLPPKHAVVFHPKPYLIAVGFETVFIVLAVIVLHVRDRKDLLLAIISIIVGLHFFGMVWALESNEYWWIGAAMCLWPIITLSFLPRNAWSPAVGLGCALILWSSIVWSFFY